MTHLESLKRQMVPLLGGEFCTWDDKSTKCEECEYPTPGRSLVFHNASYEYPQEGDYRCVDCFLAHTLRCRVTKSQADAECGQAAEEGGPVPT